MSVIIRLLWFGISLTDITNESIHQPAKRSKNAGITGKRNKEAYQTALLDNASCFNCFGEFLIFQSTLQHGRRHKSRTNRIHRDSTLRWPVLHNTTSYKKTITIGTEI